jgi:hypothetical protein
MVHAYNLSYLGGRGRRKIESSRLAWKSLKDPVSKTKQKQKRARGTAQVKCSGTTISSTTNNKTKLQQKPAYFFFFLVGLGFKLLESYLQFILLWLFQRQGLINYLPALASD